jgi:hypothetical protein
MKKFSTLLGVGVLAAGLTAPALAGTGMTLSIVRTDCVTFNDVAGDWAYPVTLQFDIYGQLTGDASDGLAAVGFDVSATLAGAAYDITAAGPNSPATITPPGEGNMNSFVKNQGITNPAGYGGTAVGGKLVQVGGAQDTIGNSVGMVAPFPTGPVVLNVGNGSPAKLAHVSITLDSEPAPGQKYTFTVDNVFGNVINPGQAGPVYSVSALDPVSSVSLDVFPMCPWDQDGNRVVNAADRGFVSANIGCNTADASNCACQLADLDGNNVVNAADRGFVAANLGLCP